MVTCQLGAKKSTSFFLLVSRTKASGSILYVHLAEKNSAGMQAAKTLAQAEPKGLCVFPLG